MQVRLETPPHTPRPAVTWNDSEESWAQRGGPGPPHMLLGTADAAVSLESGLVVLRQRVIPGHPDLTEPNTGVHTNPSSMGAQSSTLTAHGVRGHCHLVTRRVQCSRSVSSAQALTSPWPSAWL